MQKLNLPLPDEAAQSASLALQAILRQEIQQHGGSLPFSRFMELALYAPRLGYYTGGAVKLGKDGDFTTAPEISSLFGATLAQFAASVLSDQPLQVLEFGAGSGKLAYDFLQECAYSKIPVASYAILDLSGELRARQQQKLAEFPSVRWLDQLPEQFDGLILGNEVLDAMPVELVRKQEDGSWRLLQVGLDQHDEFCWLPGPVATAEQIQQLARFDDDLAPGYITEIHPAQAAFIQTLARLQLAGQRSLALFIDYGFTASEYYHPQRERGTLMCHYRHHSHDQPFFWPGLQDLTSHIDFTALALAADAAGLDVAGYFTQAGFLLQAGMTEILARTSAEQARQYLPEARALQKLVSPAEMGELFKVLALAHGVNLPAAMQAQNRLHRL